MIVYTVRGGASAVIWTDVVQMFVYVGGAIVVLVALLHRIPGGWAEVVVGRIGGGEVRRVEPVDRSEGGVYDLGGTGGRHCADARDARDGSVSGAAPAVGTVAA